LREKGYSDIRDSVLEIFEVHFPDGMKTRRRRRMELNRG
jgi:hypothetical protein